MIIGAYVEALSSADTSAAATISQRAAYRLAIVRSADAAMQRLIGCGYSSSQLCKQIGVSERNLELHFQEALGVSPKSWFQHLALHRARFELLRRTAHKGLVTEVALECGFEHFGRFSQCYRDLFGGSPQKQSYRPFDLRQREASLCENVSRTSRAEVPLGTETGDYKYRLELLRVCRSAPGIRGARTISRPTGASTSSEPGAMGLP